MKKVFCIVLLLILSVTLTVSPVYARSDNAKGAVKADLVEFIAADDPGGVVGSVLHNTTDDGYLILVINVDNTTDPLVNYDVRVWVNRPPKTPAGALLKYTVTDVLNTNAQGHGNYRVKVELPIPDTFTDDYVTVVVVLRPEFDTNQPSQCYQTEYLEWWTEGVKVPLK